MPTATAGAPPTPLHFADGEEHVHLAVSDVDRLACGLRVLVCQSREPRQWSMDKVRSVGDSIVAQLTYLLEPLRIVESDQDEGVAQIRSEHPHEQQGERQYYEVLVRSRAEISLSRYASAGTEQHDV